MSKLPVAKAYGSYDVVEMQPLPRPEDVHAFSSDDPVEHVLGDDTNAIWFALPYLTDGRHLLVYGGPESEFDADYAWPVPPISVPFAVTPGSRITLVHAGGGAAFDYKLQEASL